MKHFIISIFCLLILSSANAATMDEANELLKKGQLDEAIESYGLIVKDGYIGYELFFNLATAYSKKGDISNSILNFEKALRIKPTSTLTKQQLEQLNLKLRDKPSIYKDDGFLGFFDKLQFALSVDAWAILSICLMLLVSLVIWVSYKFQHLKSRKLIFSSCIFWFLLSCISFFICRNCYQYKYLQQEAIIFPESIKVFDQPDLNSTILFNLHQGTKVEILNKTSNMYFVQYAEKKGWINMKDVQKIEL